MNTRTVVSKSRPSGPVIVGEDVNVLDVQKALCTRLLSLTNERATAESS